jgi:hypothetical protein
MNLPDPVGERNADSPFMDASVAISSLCSPKGVNGFQQPSTCQFVGESCGVGILLRFRLAVVDAWLAWHDLRIGWKAYPTFVQHASLNDLSLRPSMRRAAILWMAARQQKTRSVNQRVGRALFTTERVGAFGYRFREHRRPTHGVVPTFARRLAIVLR